MVPYFFSVPLAVLPAGAADWLLRVTPAAGFAIQQYVPAYPQVSNAYTPQHGYYPLAPWAGFARAVRLGRGRPLPGRRPAPPEGRMSEALHAEWTKLRTLPGTGWLLLGVVAATVIISAAVSASVSCSSTAACHVDITKLSLTGTYLGQAVVAIVAVLAVSGEYATGMIRTTLAAMPRRTTVLAAKATVVTAVTLAAGTAAVLGSVLAGRLILPGHGYTPAQRLPGAVPGQRDGAARRRRHRALPGPDRAAQPRHRHRGAGRRGGHRRWCSACCTCSRSSPRWPAAPGWHGTCSRSGR